MLQDIEQNNPDNRWAIRLPVGFENTVGTGDKFRLWVNDSVVSPDLTATGFTNSYLNDEEHTVEEIWAGYIDFTFVNTQTVDIDGDGDINDFFEPDGSLGVSPATVVYELAGNVLASAEVAFYQKIAVNKGRIYLKQGISGTFVKNSTIKVNTVEGGIANTRDMGTIDYVSVADSQLGVLAIINKDTPFPVNPDSFVGPLNDFALVNEEYWFYQNTEVSEGSPQPASFPNSRSRDWVRMTNVPVDPTRNNDRNGNNNQGVYHIYTRFGREWQWVNTYLLPGTGPDSRAGKHLEFAQQDSLYC